MNVKTNCSIRWSRILLGALLTVLCAFTPHAIATSTSLIPYPASYPRAGWAALAEWIPVAIGVFAFVGAMRRRVPEWSEGTRLLIGCLLVLMVKETLLRRAVMSGWVTTAWVYNLLDNLRFAIPIILSVLAGTIAASAPRAVMLGAAVATGAGIAFLAQPWADVAVASLIRHVGALGHDAVYPSPYGWQVQLPSYVTFVEPVIAAIAMVAIMVPGRSAADRFSAYLATVAAIILIRGKLVLIVTNMTFQKEGALMGFLAEGQFFVEGVLLAVGAALTWWWANEPEAPMAVGP